MAHDGCLNGAMQAFHETFGCGVVWVVALQRWMSHIFARLLKRFDSNYLPWSVVMICGQPKRVIQP